MDLETFQSLPTEEVARLVREAGPKVCVFPTKGTRRWFMLEHPPRQDEDFTSAYFEAFKRRQIEIYQLLFDHGLDTVLSPFVDQYMMRRGEGYVQMAAVGLAWIASDPDILDFYRESGVRVRFYGDHRGFLGPTPHAYLSDMFDDATAQTSAHDRHRLFFGMFAHDPAKAVAKLAIRYYVEHGDTPDKRALVEMYYGEDVEPADLFIGFGKLRVFDIPLILTSTTDLYFTVSPSLYFTGRQLRSILYDHLYARGRTKTDLRPEDWAPMKSFYQANVGNTLGIGARQEDKVWYPLPQVELPLDLQSRESPGGAEDDRSSRRW